MTTAVAVTTRVLSGFDDPAFGAVEWDALLRSGATDSIYLSYSWLRAWWETVGAGELLLVAAERGGHVVALAPFYSRWKMVSFLGSEVESDVADFVGDVSEPNVLDALLATARERVRGFKGFDFRRVPERSGTGPRLEAAAARLKLSCHDEWSGGAPSPIVDLAGRPDAAAALVERPRVLKEERFFASHGAFEVHHWREGGEILPQLETFFAQHIARRAVTDGPSPLEDPAQQAFYRRFTELASDTGVLRFTRIDWQDRPIAFHFGMSCRGRYYWCTPSFALDVARHSPGRVLIRHLLRAAIDEGARTFDFGFGDETFKAEWTTDVEYLWRWSMFPRES